MGYPFVNSDEYKKPKAGTVATAPQQEGVNLDYSPLIQLYKEYYRPDEMASRERSAKSTAIAGAVGNILRSVMDIQAGVQTGYPVATQRGPSPMLQRYYSLIEENRQRRDAMNKLMLDEVARNIATKQKFEMEKELAKMGYGQQDKMQGAEQAGKEKLAGMGFQADENMYNKKHEGDKEMAGIEFKNQGALQDDRQDFELQKQKLDAEYQMKINNAKDKAELNRLMAEYAARANEIKLRGEETRKTNKELYPNGKTTGVGKKMQKFMTLNEKATGKEVTSVTGIQADAIINYMHSNNMLDKETATMIKNLQGAALPDDQRTRIIADNWEKINPTVLNNILEANQIDDDADPLGYGDLLDQ